MWPSGWSGANDPGALAATGSAALDLRRGRFLRARRAHGGGGLRRPRGGVPLREPRGDARDELLRMKCWEVVHPDERALVRERGFARQAGVDVPQHLPYRLYTKAGETLWVAFSGTRIDHEGEPAMLGTAIDISRHKQVEEALRRSEGRLRRLVDSNVLAVLISDLNGRILEPNDAFLSMLGYTRADLPLRWDALTPRELLPTADRAITELRNTGVATPFEKEYLHRDGHRVPVLIGIALLEHGGDECITFVIDLTK